ncbi:MAG TPA: hypothetical protein VKU61_01025 [Candidatus Binatia bacterium]|nr:hypothetical protein [Candidatus Binatia bacterium]
MPLFVTPFLPLQDLGNNLALSSLIPRVLWGHGLAARYYRVQALPVPYWTTSLIMGAMTFVVGGRIAAKIMVGLSLVMLPLGTMRLLHALRRSPRMGLWAFALVWDFNMYWGWTAFVFGVGLTLVVLAHIVEAQNAREAVRTWPGVAAVALTHAQATAILCIAAAALVFAGAIGKRIRLHAISVAAVLVLWPWAVARLRAGGALPSGPWAQFDDPVPQRIMKLIEHTVGNITPGWGEHVMEGVFLVFLVSPLLLFAWDRAPRIKEDRAAVALYVTALGLYLALPGTLLRPFFYWALYQRQATFFLLCGLLLARPCVEGRAGWLLAPGILATLLTSAVVAHQFAAFGTDAAPFAEVIRRIEPDSAVLTLTFENGDPNMKTPSFDEFHGYIIAEKGGYDPYVFDQPSHPIVHRNGLPRPQSPDLFSMKEHGSGYDYIVVQGKSHDPVREGVYEGRRVQRIADIERWRIYKIVTLPRSELGVPGSVL